MSLHKFAEQVASQGRGDDSLLVHMTPDEVRNLQQFAQANGTTLTINPTTGLPEAGMLSDLFKAIAPIALGAFLGPGAFGIAGMGLSAGMAGAAVGGITTLATGSLSRGLMAGLGAYGGAGLAQGFMDAGTTALGGAGAETALQAPSVDSFVGNAEGMTSGDAFNNFLKSDANPAVAGKADVFGAGAKAAMADPMGFAKQNLGNLAYAAAPIAAGAMVPTTTKLPTPANNNYIRQFDYNINPDTGRPDPLYGMRAMTPVKASDWGDKTFQSQRDAFRQQPPNPYELGVGSLNQPPQQPQQPPRMNTGGIVALADGGMPRFAGADRSLINSNAYEDRDDFSTGANNNLLNQQVKAPDPLTDLYQSVLGRAPESQDVRDYWGNQFKGGATPGIDPDEITTFQGAARGELLANLNATRPAGNQLVNDPNSVTGLTRPAEALTPAEGIAAIAAKQASDAKIANTNLAALQPANTTATTTTGGGLTTLLANAAGDIGNAAGAGTTTTNVGLTNLLANAAGDIGNAAQARNATGATTTGATTTGRPTAEQAAATIATIYRNVLGRDPDPNGMAYWTQQLTSGAIDSATMYTDILKGAQANKETGNFGLSFADAQKGYTGYSSADASNIADEWVRNVLGREVTDADRKTQWYKDAVNKEVMNTYAKAENIYNNFRDYAALQTGSPAANLDLYQASKLMGPQAKVTTVTGGGGNDIVVPSGYHLENGVIVKNVDATQHTSTVVDKPTNISTTLATSLPVGVSGNTGPSQIGGGATVNPNGTITSSPLIPGIPVGGFTGMTDVRDAYTKGGGSTGYTPQAPKTMAEFELAYNKQTGDSLAAYNYLMGKGGGKYPTKSSVPQIAVPYGEYVLGKKPAAAKPVVKSTDTAAVTLTGDQTMPFANLYQSVLQREGDATGLAYWKERFGDTIDADELAVFKAAAAAEIAARGLKTGTTTTKASTATIGGTTYDLTKQSTQPPEDNNGKWDWDAAEKKWVQYGKFAGGGMAYAVGGGLGSLGSYSDGGRLLRGPGDGVSDSIPATIGRKQQPARLADGEFVIPARIVSELGNGSTDAGAKKLYAMMDRVQRARGKTTGKNKVAANSRSDKYLPA